jgi:hypothetical protein
MAEKDASKILLPIEWHVPDELVTRYANNLLVQHTEHEFILSFFELQPPLTVGSPEEQAAQLQAVGAVRAECVARVVISASRMASFVETLRSSSEKFPASSGEKDGGA